MLEVLNKLSKDKKINNYFHDLLFAKAGEVPDEVETQLLDEAVAMSAIGVSSDEDHKTFAYIKQHTRSIAKDILDKPLSIDGLAKVSSIVYENRNDKPISTVLGFYIAVDSALRKLGFSIRKLGYPMIESNWRGENPHDINKWMYAMRDIYIRSNRNIGFNKAFNIVTSGWEKMETLDFKHWLRFYQEGVQHKYKIAQQGNYYQLEGDGAPTIPYDHLAAALPKVTAPGMPLMDMFESKEKSNKEKEEVEANEQQKAVDRAALKAEVRKKLISRLQAAERIVTDPAIQEDLNSALDMGVSKWLETLHYLKRCVQTSCASMSEDLIIRHANQLTSMGHPKAGQLIIRLAQGAPLPTPVEELPPVGPGAGVEGLMGGDVPLDPDLEESEGEDDQAMKDVVRSMNNEFIDDDSEDLGEADDDDDLTVVAQAIGPDEELIERSLEEAPAMPEEEPEPIPEIDIEEPMELPEPAPEPAPEPSDYGPKSEAPSSMTEPVTIQSVVERLERVADILKNREIPRELARIDIDLDDLGMAQFFPTLGEAHKSALEGNQYQTTRIDDVLSKLRGALEPSKKVQLTTDPSKADDLSDALEQVRRNLQGSKESEMARQDRRSERQSATEIATEELEAPVQIKMAPPARATR